MPWSLNVIISIIHHYVIKNWMKFILLRGVTEQTGVFSLQYNCSKMLWQCFLYSWDEAFSELCHHFRIQGIMSGTLSKYKPSQPTNHIWNDVFITVCNQYYCSVVYILYIYIAWKIIEKKNILPRRDSHLRRRSQSTGMLSSIKSCIPKKRFIKPTIKQHCFFPFVQC